MGYYDELSQGSKFHKVRLNKRGMRIMPADDSDACSYRVSGHREACDQVL